MLDLTAFAAREWYEAIRTEREHEAGKRTWLRRLRELQRVEREAARLAASKPASPAAPRGLTGAHTPWI